MPLLVAANLGLTRRWARDVTYAALGALSGLVLVLGLLDLLSAALGVTPRHTAGLLQAGSVLTATGLASALLLLPGVRRRLAKFVPLDPESPVHALAAGLSLLLVGTQLATQLSTDVLAEQAAGGEALGRLDLVGQELPFLAAAFLGVGLWVRRSPGQALRRLGFVRPAWWHLVLALAAAGLFYAFGTGADALAQTLTPDLAHKVDAANQRLFGRLGDPAGVATLALAAGICEEALFRGAMQPRLTLVWTSLVFASVHTQYGLSLDALAVFVLACGLGLLRRVTNTTACALCHVVYNALVGLTLEGPWLLPALGAELVLVGLLLAPLAARRSPFGAASRP